MYQNVLVPLDRSVESEGILDVVPELVSADGQATLLTVIPPGRTRSLGELVVLGTQQEEEDRSRALAYLNRIANRLKDNSVAATTAVVVNDSVPAAIVGYANGNSVDLISMFTHDRRGLGAAGEGERRPRGGAPLGDAGARVSPGRPGPGAGAGCRHHGRRGVRLRHRGYVRQAFARANLFRHCPGNLGLGEGRRNPRSRRRGGPQPLHHSDRRGPADGAGGDWPDSRPGGPGLASPSRRPSCWAKAR